MRARGLLAIALAALVAMSVSVGIAAAQTGGTDPGASPEQRDNNRKDDDFGDKCRPGIPGIDQIAEGACDLGKGAIDGATSAPGQIAEGAATGALNQLTEWMTDAATWTTKQIATGIQNTSTPELKASWYEERFGSMVALSLGLAALVTMMALASAAIRRDPEALGATVYGMFRAGLGTGLVLVLTVLALGVADEISNTMAS